MIVEGWRRGAYSLHILPALDEHANYIYIIFDEYSREALVIDPGEAPPVEEFLTTHQARLGQIWLTHHHWDHIDGVEPLSTRHRPRIVGAEKDAYRLPRLSHGVKEGDSVRFGNLDFMVHETPGHTQGHVVFHGEGILFSGDTLFSLGCGRLLEGSPEQMFASLRKIDVLENDPWVCCGHEYTATNAKFSLEVDPENAALRSRVDEVRELRRKALPTVPVRLSMERTTNPFLRTREVAAFAALRAARDRF